MEPHFIEMKMTECKIAELYAGKNRFIGAGSFSNKDSQNFTGTVQLLLSWGLCLQYWKWLEMDNNIVVETSFCVYYMAK